MTRWIALLGLTGILLCLTGCSSPIQVMDGDGMVRKPFFAEISQDAAKLMMQDDDGHVIVDVRTPEEYAEGYIPDAINIPNESISDTPPAELPDKKQIILVYCRSGRRSKEASQKLANMGYVNVYEFGGINTWTGDIVREEAGSQPAQEEGQMMKLKINETEVPVTWQDNPSVMALKDILPLSIQMSMYGGFEQVGSIGQSLVRQDEETTTKPGDIMLYAGDSIVVFYGSNSWAYTKLGHIDLSEQELTDLLSKSNVVITIAE